MGLPSKKTPKRLTRQRRSHHALSETTLATCSKCMKPRLPHRACTFCGFYDGKEVIKVVNRKEKKRQQEKKKTEKAEKEKQKTPKE